MIFAEARTLWRKTHHQAEHWSGGAINPPQLFVLTEYESGLWEYRDRIVSLGTVPRCLEPIRRQWIFDGTEFTLTPDAWQAARAKVAPDPPGRFRSLNEVGIIDFHIAPDRKRLILTYWFGPRYGRGFVYRIIGQGKRASLLQDPQSPGWFS